MSFVSESIVASQYRNLLYNALSAVSHASVDATTAVVLAGLILFAAVGVQGSDPDFGVSGIIGDNCIVGEVGVCIGVCIAWLISSVGDEEGCTDIKHCAMVICLAPVSVFAMVFCFFDAICLECS